MGLERMSNSVSSSYLCLRTILSTGSSRGISPISFFCGFLLGGGHAVGTNSLSSFTALETALPMASKTPATHVNIIEIKLFSPLSTIYIFFAAFLIKLNLAFLGFLAIFLHHLVVFVLAYVRGMEIHFLRPFPKCIEFGKPFFE